MKKKKRQTSRPSPSTGLSLRTSFFIALCATIVVAVAALFSNEATRVLGVATSRSNTTGCVYWVRPGDNLYRIGLRYGVSPAYIATLNGIYNMNLVFAGTALVVPCAPTPARIVRPSGCAPSQTYVVVPGDNLFRIALNHGSTIEWIRSANNLYGRVLRSGMQLKIPCPGSVKYKAAPLATVEPTEEPTPTEELATATVASTVQTTMFATPTQAILTPSTETTIRMENNQFRPDSLTVKIGTSVTWFNNDNKQHSVSCQNCPAEVPLISPPLQLGGPTFSFTFQTLGLYNYTSPQDQGMNGTIIVTQ